MVLSYQIYPIYIDDRYLGDLIQYLPTITKNKKEIQVSKISESLELFGTAQTRIWISDWHG